MNIEIYQQIDLHFDKKSGLASRQKTIMGFSLKSIHNLLSTQTVHVCIFYIVDELAKTITEVPQSLPKGVECASEFFKG